MRISNSNHQWEHKLISHALIYFLQLVLIACVAAVKCRPVRGVAIFITTDEQLQ